MVHKCQLLTRHFFTLMLLFISDYGKVAEWSNAVAWKAAVVQATAGSNPVLSAN